LVFWRLRLRLLLALALAGTAYLLQLVSSALRAPPLPRCSRHAIPSLLGQG